MLLIDCMLIVLYKTNQNTLAFIFQAIMCLQNNKHK